MIFDQMYCFTVSSKCTTFYIMGGPVSTNKSFFIQKIKIIAAIGKTF